MSKRIADQIEELFLSVLDEKYELVDVEYVKEGAFYYLRVFIDKDGGLDIDEISDITRVLNKLLDEKDPIQQQYFLEVFLHVQSGGSLSFSDIPSFFLKIKQ